MRALAVLTLLVLGTATSCVRQARVASPGPATVYGSCEGACQHYLDCRGSGDAALASSCMAECDAIFVTDGRADEDALAEFEDLDCPEAVAFVEGDRGHAPGDGRRQASRAAATADR